MKHILLGDLFVVGPIIYEPFEWYFAENARVDFNIMFDIENASFHFNAYTKTPNTIAANQCPIR